MAIATIRQLEIRMENGSNEPSVQKDAVIEASAQTWIAGSLVYTSGNGASVVLNGIATAGTLIYGQSPDSAVGSGDPNPPNRLFGKNHFPFDVRDRILEANLTYNTDANIGTTSGATWNVPGSGTALAPGQQFGVRVPTTGAYTGINFVDASNTTQKVFEVVALALAVPAQALTDNNPRIWVKTVTAAIQG